MPTLKIVPVPYRSSDLEAWKDGKYAAVFGVRRGWGALEKDLAERAGKRRQGRINGRHERGDARFFGEAVAAKSTGEACRYGSFKWLTSGLWGSQMKLPEGHAAEFKNALQDHFSEELPTVRAMATKLSHRLPLSKSGRFQKPVAPDLWSLTKTGSHRFIEVKLSDRRDIIRDAQLAGMAVIATCLGSAHVVSVEIFKLYCDRHNPPPDSERDRETFEKFCGVLRGYRGNRR